MEKITLFLNYSGVIELQKFCGSGIKVSWFYFPSEKINCFILGFWTHNGLSTQVILLISEMPYAFQDCDCLFAMCLYSLFHKNISKIAKACLVQQKHTLFSAYLTSWIHLWVVEQETVAAKKKLDLRAEVRESGRGSRDNRTWNPPFSSVKLLDVLRDFISMPV